MAFSVNLAVITGNVTRDPELKFTPSGQAVCTFGVATNHSVKKGDQWEDVPTFHNIVVWGKVAEFLSNVLKKGIKVSLTGRISNRQYDAKDGTKKYISEIIADTVIPFTDRHSGPSPAANTPSSSKSSSSTAPSHDDQPVPVTEDIIIPDDMPF